MGSPNVNPSIKRTKLLSFCYPIVLTKKSQEDWVCIEGVNLTENVLNKLTQDPLYLDIFKAT